MRTVETKIVYILCGRMFDDEEVFTAQNREHPNPPDMPSLAVGYRFEDHVEESARTDDTGEAFGRSSIQNVSKTYFPGAKLLTLKDVKASPEFGEESILYQNMQFNNWNPVLRTRHGTVRPYNSETMEIV